MNDSFDFDSDMEDPFDDELRENDPIIYEDPFINPSHTNIEPTLDSTGILGKGFEKELEKIESHFKNRDSSSGDTIENTGVISLESTIDYNKFDLEQEMKERRLKHELHHFVIRFC